MNARLVSCPLPVITFGWVQVKSLDTSSLVGDKSMIAAQYVLVMRLGSQHFT